MADTPKVHIPNYPIVVVQPGGVRFVQDWEIHVAGITHVVPKDYFSNFASVPWCVRWLISPVDEVVIIASLLHDYLVREFGGGPADYNWVYAAKVMDVVMKRYAGTSRTRRIKRKLVYYGIRLYGWFK